MMTPERWQQIERLYEAALEREESLRPEFLASACAGDPELLREVESLLVLETRADDFLKEGALEVAARGLARDEARAAKEPVAGQMLSHYRIVQKIGEGGMGVVYEARDDRLGRAVAIKTIRGTEESDQARRQLWREARSLARVSHPHVCQVFDAGEDGKTLFLVMELLEGQSLAGRLASGPLPVPEAVQIAREILEALIALHGLQIVHHDLKPSNVFLTPHGVKLLDFGLARPAGAAMPGDREGEPAPATITAPGRMVGTPHYMTPEQVGGQAAGPAADIFAAGCILYEMLAGKRAFDGAFGGRCAVRRAASQPAAAGGVQRNRGAGSGDPAGDGQAPSGPLCLRPRDALRGKRGSSVLLRHGVGGA